MIICRFASRTLRVLLHSNDTKGLIRHQNLPCLYESLGMKILTCRPMSASFLPLAWHKPAAHRALSHTPLHALLHLLSFADLQGLQDLLCFYCYVSISLKASHQLIKDAYTSIDSHDQASTKSTRIVLGGSIHLFPEFFCFGIWWERRWSAQMLQSPSQCSRFKYATFSVWSQS